jgi:hypothetical protein
LYQRLEHRAGLGRRHPGLRVDLADRLARRTAVASTMGGSTRFVCIRIGALA